MTVLDEDKKRKNSTFIFKLTKTVNPSSYESEQEASTPLLKLSNVDNRHFVLEQHGKRRRDSEDDEGNPSLEEGKNEAKDDELPPEINQMIEQYLTLTKKEKTGDNTRRKKPSKKHFTGESAKIATLPSLDYVYDIYHLESVPEDEMTRYEQQNVGFVKIVNKDMDLLPDEEEDSNNEIRSDDEDSNEENYYQNDYPEDEDDDRSVLFGSEGEEIAEEEDEKNNKQPWNYDKILRADEGDNANDNDEYTELFNKLDGSGNILKSINKNNFVDLDKPTDATEATDSDAEEEDIDVDFNELDHDNSLMTDYGEDIYPRNNFFPTDEDDPLAQHRDRIFGQLQKKIDEH